MKRALITLLLLAAPAAADDKVNARALQEQGIELYKAKKYDDAIAALKKSYQLDPQFDTLYALAQAERLGGRCPEAIPHYNQILEQTTDPVLAAAVQNNLGLCVTDKKDETKPECTADKPAPVVVKSTKGSGLATGLFLTTGLFAGAAAGMFVAAGHSQDAAANATTFDSYNHFVDRAGLERGLSYGFAAAAAVSLGGALYVVLRKPAETSPTVSASVSPKGTMVLVQARW